MKNRLERLQQMLPEGWTVATYSPGDGVTRYKFIEGHPGASYFSANGETVRGYAKAEKFVEGLREGGRYKIVRMFFSGSPRSKTIKRGLTLEQAQAHCANPETSSSTATSAAARRITARRGRWFDGYERE